MATQGVTGEVQFQLDWKPRGERIEAYLNGGADERYASVTLGGQDFKVFALFALVEPAPPEEGQNLEPAFWDAVPLDVQAADETPVDDAERSALRQAILDALAADRPCPVPPWTVETGADDCRPSVVTARKLGRRHHQADRTIQRLKTEERAEAQKRAERQLSDE